MDIFSMTQDYVLAMPIAQAWPEFETIFRQIISFRPRHWLLPVKACEAVGGSIEQAVPAVAAIACAQIGIVILDDMLDADPRGEYHRLGFPVAANLGAAFQFAGLEAVLLPGFAPIRKLRALQSANQMLWSVAIGQHFDIQAFTNEASYWQIVEYKSASFFGAAFFLGALLGGASSVVARKIQKFGHLYGEMIQIHDDLNDTLGIPASPDWIEHRAPLPILFALVVDHPERRIFGELYENSADVNALREAQAILVRCGAVSYCMDQLLHRHQVAQKILNSLKLPDGKPLMDLAGEIVEPVWKLLAELE